MDDQNEVIRFLSSPLAYAAKSKVVERIDTHAAIVFLTDDLAYKMKKAVRYPYLDFSSLQAREHAIMREIELNHRTAPDLYVTAQPVTRGADGQLGIGREGTVVEWLLVMRRFQAADLFDRMAQEGRLNPALMRELADRIADFHAIAREVRTPSPGGGMVGVLDVDRRGFLKSKQDYLSDVTRAIDYQDRADEALRQLSPLLNQRRSSGHVRHCHGDLHLGNVCLFNNVPTLFDCIEFNDALAEIDVLYDLAFLLMDLEHRGLRELGNAVFNRYLDRRDEDDGMPAMAFFLSTRAAVRSHVGFTAAMSISSETEAAQRAVEARAYLDLAVNLLDEKSPRLIAIGGLSGSGKSTLAASIAPEIGACPGARVLRSDVERKRLMGVAPEERLPEQAYQDEIGRRVYELLIERARILLQAGHSVVLDAVFARERERTHAEELARRTGVPFSGFWLEAPVTDLKQRLELRTRDASDATQAVLERQLSYDLGNITWTRITAGRPPESVLADARAAMRF